MDTVLRFLNTSFGIYNIRGIYVEPTYWMAGAIALLAFMLIFSLARIRYLYVHWNLGNSAVSMLLWGFVLAIILEGVLLLSGRTILTEILGWKNAPKPISTILDMGREKLVNVLGVTDEIPSSSAKEPPTYQSMVAEYENLSSEDKDMFKSFICQ